MSEFDSWLEEINSEILISSANEEQRQQSPQHQCGDTVNATTDYPPPTIQSGSVTSTVMTAMVSSIIYMIYIYNRYILINKNHLPTCLFIFYLLIYLFIYLSLIY